MSKFEIPSVLSRVRVWSPCNQDWNTMRGNDKVRFCDHCAKHVHDLSEMTPEAALELVERSEGRLCVRFIPNSDGSPHVKDDVEPLTGGFRMPQLRLAAGVLAAALTGGMASAGTIPAPPDAVVSSPARPVHPLSGTGLVDLTVTVAPNIRYVNLPAKLVSEETGETWRTVSDSDGHIRFADVPFGKYRVEIKNDLFGLELRFEVAEAIRELEADIGFDRVQGGISLRDVMESWEWVRRNNQRAAETRRDAIVYADWNVALAEARLERAVAVEDLEKVRAMLKAGFDLNRQAAKCDEPFIHRLMRQLRATPRTQELMAALAAAGADFNAANQFGVTPLMYAVLTGPGQVKTLLAAGANVNAADDNGRTPLMLAAYEGKLDVVKLLAQAGADVNARDAKGQSVLSYALAGGNERKKLIQLLKKAGAVE
jgi:hypothetical protein